MMISPIMSGYPLHREIAGLISFRGIQGISTNEEFLNAFSVRVFDSEVDVESQAAFDIASDLSVRIAGEGVFEVIFHHLP